MYILGVSMSNHDRSACLLKEGEVIGAIAEERLDRRKKSEGFYGQDSKEIILPPLLAINCLLKAEKITTQDLGLVICGRSIRSCREEFLNYFPIEDSRVFEPPQPAHHIAHAYSAYGTMPFAEAAVLVIDEQGSHFPEGEFEKCSWFYGSKKKLDLIKQFRGQKNSLSLGMFYDAIAGLLGLSEAAKPSAGKLMGLAAYGKNRQWPSIFSYQSNGDIEISLSMLDQFLCEVGVPIRYGMDTVEANELDNLLHKYFPLRRETELAIDLAYYAQAQLEEAILHIAAHLYRQSGTSNLAYAGGVALNCIANSRLKEAGWRDVYVHPAASDDGNAIGLAYYGWFEVVGESHNGDRCGKIFSPFTGPIYSPVQIKQAFQSYELESYIEEVDSETVAAHKLYEGNIIAWFQERSEWGPRSLGHRSLLAPPLKENIKNEINTLIKFRECYRPLAISGTLDGLHNILCLEEPASALDFYMLSVAKIKNKLFSQLSHADNSLRYQIVKKEIQARFFRLLQLYGNLSAHEVIINTSFNTLGEPMVESPEDAIRQCLVSNTQYLFIDRYLFSKERISTEQLSYLREKALDAMKLNPISIALGLEAAGYPEMALKILEIKKINDEIVCRQGIDTLRIYYSLLFRIMLKIQDREKAAFYGEKIIAYAAMPSDVYQVASFLENYYFVDKNKNNLTAKLIKSISKPGEAQRFFIRMLEEQE